MTDHQKENSYRTLFDETKRIRGLLENSCKQNSGSKEVSGLDNGLDFPRLNHLERMFQLTEFELDCVLLCAAYLMDETVRRHCHTLGAGGRSGPSLRLAMNLFKRTTWDVVSPSRPLRAFRLVEFESIADIPNSPMRVDERIFTYLQGTDHLDQRLIPYILPQVPLKNLPPSLSRTGDTTYETLTSHAKSETLPVVRCSGDDPEAARALAWYVCQKLQAPLYYLDIRDIPTTAAERHSFCLLWQREIMLSRCALFLDCSEGDIPGFYSTLTYVLGMLRGIQFVHSPQPLTGLSTPFISVSCNKPQPGEQQLMFERMLGKDKGVINGHAEAVAQQFRLGLGSIVGISQSLKQQARTGNVNSHTFWDLCRTQAIPKVGSLAQKIEPKAGWDDLVLPAREANILRTISCHVKNRRKVYQDWGFAQKSSRGLGVSALFSGVSGTGKTMAAEVLAQDLRLDLYRIDLSSVVNKYVGETEKNLRRIFDAAEEGGALLLFDEADALFGKRSEIKDSHDRYANIEVSYLLQRMESYRGLAILTTNMKSSLDEAFLRRIRFIVDFPFPSAELREQIWKTIFPKKTGLNGLNYKKLAKLNVTGGSISNIALNAAFLAADQDLQVGMDHLYQAAASEYVKLDKPLTQSETAGWRH